MNTEAEWTFNRYLFFSSISFGSKVKGPRVEESGLKSFETLMLTFSRENFNEMPRNQSEINKAGYRLQLRKKP